MKDPDFDLIKRLAAGDGEVVGIFYERYQGLVGRLARRSGLAEADAQEVVQDTFRKAWESAGKFRGLGSVRSWLCGIARHVIADCVESERKRKKIFVEPSHSADTDEEEEQPAAPDYGPDKLLELAQDRGCLAQCLGKLNPLHSEVLKRRIFGPELREQDIARALKIPLGTVKSRTNKALRALAPCVQKCREGKTADA